MQTAAVGDSLVAQSTGNGGSSGSPRVEFKMPQCHVEVPSHSIEDVISLESTFTSLQSDMESNEPDDLEITAYGVALA